MFGQFNQIKDFDTIFFVPHPEDDNQVKVEIAQYKEPSEKVPGSAMGDMFDIINRLYLGRKNLANGSTWKNNF